LARGRPPFSYAIDQVRFKHEQPQVLLIESHVTIGTIQLTQRSQRALGISTQKLARGLTNRHIEIHGKSLENSGVITTKVE